MDASVLELLGLIICAAAAFWWGVWPNIKRRRDE